MHKLIKLFNKNKIDGYIIPKNDEFFNEYVSPSKDCLLYTSPSPRDRTRSRMPSSA